MNMNLFKETAQKKQQQNERNDMDGVSVVRHTTLALTVMLHFQRRINEIEKNGPPDVTPCSYAPLGIIF